MLASRVWMTPGSSTRAERSACTPVELPDPGGGFDQLVEPLTDLAERHGLQVEPGKNVLEIRPQGFDKGDALRPSSPSWAPVR